MEKAEGHADFERLLSRAEGKNSLKQASQAEKGDPRCSSSILPELHEDNSLPGTQQQQQHVATNARISSPEVRVQSGENGISGGSSSVKVLFTEGTTSLANNVEVMSDLAAKRSALMERKKKKHVCHVCHRECPSKHKLKRHLSTHSEERPFFCELCGKSFKWTEYLHKHMRQQHEGSSSSHTTRSTSKTTATATPAHTAPSTTATTTAPPTLSPPPASTHSPSSTTSPSPGLEASNASSGNTSSMLSPTVANTSMTVVLTLAQSNSSVSSSSFSQLQSPSWSTASSQGQQNVVSQQQMQQQTRSLGQENHNLTQHQNQHLNVQIAQQNQPQAQFHQQQQQQSMQGMSGGGGMQGCMMTTNCVGQVNQLQQMNTTSSQGGLVPQKQNASIGVNMNVSEMNTGLMGGVPGMGMDPAQMMSNSGTMQMGAAGGGGAQTNTMNSVSQIIGEIQSDASAIRQNQGYADSSTCLPQPQNVSQSMVAVTQQAYNQQLMQQSNIGTEVQHASDLQSLQQQMQQSTNTVQMSSQGSMSHATMSSIHNHPIPPPDLIPDSHLSIPQASSNGTPSNMMQNLPNQFMPDSLVNPLYGTGSGNVTMNMNTVMVSQPTTMNYTIGSGDNNGSMDMTSGMVAASQSAPMNYATGNDSGMNMSGDIMVSQSSYPSGSGDGSMNMSGMVSQPTTMNYPVQMGQPNTQTSNVYSTVPSYMEMPSQQMVYDNSQQGMMGNEVMNNNYGVMQQNGLLAPNQQNVGMMDHSMYGQGHEGHSMMMDQSQMQQPQQQQMMPSTGYMPQLQDHMLQPTAQDTSHMTQLGDHMTTAQSHENHMMQFTQQPESTPNASTNPLQGQVSTTQTTDTDFEGPTATTIIIHDEDMSTEISPVDESLRRNVGIQCEVGPETIRALLEEEAVFEQDHSQQQPSEDTQQQEQFSQQGNDNSFAPTQQVGNNGGGDGSSYTGDPDPDRMVLKYPCESENCSKAYIHRKDLIRHMKNRHGFSPKKLETVVMETREKPFICPVSTCRRSYYHMKDLRRHQRLCHNVAPESAGQSSGNGSGNEDDKTQLRYPCDFPGCLRSYVHKKDLIRHKRLYHKDPSQKPSIPLPVRYTELELKRIRQEVKQEIDKTVEKIRLDSTGSTITSSGEEPPNSATSIESDMDLSAASVLAASSMVDQPPTSLALSIVDSMQLALLIGGTPTTTMTATSGTQSSSNQVQLSDILAVANAPTTGAGIKPLMADVSLAQIINSAVQSGVVLSTPPPPLLTSDQTGEVKSESQEEDEAAKISSEAAAIIRSLDESQQLTNIQNEEKTQQQQQSDNILNLATVVFPSNGVFNVGSLLNVSDVSTVQTPSVSTPSASTSPPSVVASLMAASGQSDGGGQALEGGTAAQYDPATVLVSKSSDSVPTLNNEATRLFVVNSSQSSY